MFLTNYNATFILALTIFSFLSVNFSSLFLTWMFMELNLLLVVPLLLVKSNQMKEQHSIPLKYFMVQVVGSLFILISMIFLGNYTVQLEQLNFILLSSLMLKAGVPPLHFWLPQIMNSLNTLQAFILLCIQKVIPLFLMSILFNELMVVFILLASVMGGLFGLNQNSMMKILAYSSMVHMAWMMASLVSKMSPSYFYFLVYSVITAVTLYTMNMFFLKTISDTAISNKNLMFKLFFTLILLTLSGTPPFIGFFSKIYILMTVMNTKYSVMSLFLIFGSTMSFYFYVRVFILSSLFNSLNLKESPQKFNFYLMILFLGLNMVFILILWAIS